MNMMVHPRLSADGPIEFGRKDGGQSSAGSSADDNVEFRQLLDALAERDREIKTFADKASAEIKANGQMATETKAALEKLAEGGVEIQARLMAVEQKLAQRRGGAPFANDEKSLGARFTETPEFKALQQRGKGTAVMNVKAITSATSGAGVVGDAIRPNRLAGIIAPPDRPMTIRDLIAPGRTDSNAIEYVVETGFTNAAAPVAENTLKPESDITFDLATKPVRTLAHWFLASRQALSDIPQLQSYIDTRGRYGLAYVEEQQILAGNGTGQNLSGLIPNATAYDFATYSKSADTKIDRLLRAILQVRVGEYRASGIVLNPIDWADIVTTKDADGRYIWADPSVNNGQNLWGLPVVDTTAMASGKFMCGAFNIAAGFRPRERQRSGVDRGRRQPAPQHGDRSH